MQIKLGVHIYIYESKKTIYIYAYITIIPVYYTCNNVTNNKYGVFANFVVMSDNIMIIQSESYPVFTKRKLNYEYIYYINKYLGL